MMNENIKIYIGYDTRERVAFNVLSYSIMKHSSKPVSITPVYLGNIKEIFYREKNSLSSTEFSISRFLVPFLNEYKGWAIFLDCDMLMLEDIYKLWQLKDDQYAVQVCKHNYIPKTDTKFLGELQTKYEKKNWSSVMLINCAKCKALTPSYINTAPGLQLHQFKWLEDENLIGSLPLEWNWLVGEYKYNSYAKNIHYTLGGPYIEEYKNCEYSDKWFEYYNESCKV